MSGGHAKANERRELKRAAGREPRWAIPSRTTAWVVRTLPLRTPSLCASHIARREWH